MTTLDRQRANRGTDVAARAGGLTVPLLLCGAVAGPLFAAAAIIQAFTRTGFDILRNPISQLSDGSLGWINVANFVVYGTFTVAGSIGLARSLAGTPGGRWAPRLLAVGGAAILVGGCFRLDPGNGFPPGAPTGQPTTLSWQSYAHLAGGGIGFIALICACFVLGHHYARTARPRAALAARISAAVFIAGDVWSMSGGAAGPLTLCIGVLTGMLFISTAITAQLMPTGPWRSRGVSRDHR